MGRSLLTSSSCRTLKCSLLGFGLRLALSSDLQSSSGCMVRGAWASLLHGTHYSLWVAVKTDRTRGKEARGAHPVPTDSDMYPGWELWSSPADQGEWFYLCFGVKILVKKVNLCLACPFCAYPTGSSCGAWPWTLDAACLLPRRQELAGSSKQPCMTRVWNTPKEEVAGKSGTLWWGQVPVITVDTFRRNCRHLWPLLRGLSEGVIIIRKVPNSACFSLLGWL